MAKLTDIDAAKWDLKEAHIDTETLDGFLKTLVKDNPEPPTQDEESHSRWDKGIATKLLDHFGRQMVDGVAKKS
jgi:hypothetical protein